MQTQPNKLLKRLVFGLMFVMLGSVHSLQAKYVRYQPELDNSQWSFTGNRLQCRLSQEIPLYGQAYFVATSGRPNMMFRLKVARNEPAEFANAYMEALPPLWRPGVESRNLGTVDLIPGEEPVELDHDKAWRLLTELEQGFDPAFRYTDWLDGRDTVVVSLSSVRFSHHYQDFINCVGQLLPFEFKDIAQSVLHYEFNSVKFTPESKQILAKIKSYLNEDKALDVILIAGHTDSEGKGRYNQRLSTNRAEAVKNFFVQAGIPAKRIKVNAFGESRPTASNANPLGRAENRRVVINLLK